MKRVAAFVLAVIFMLSSCAKGGDNKNGENKSENSYKNIIYLTGYNFDSLNPLEVKNNVNRDIFSLVYQSAYKISSEGEPLPLLAESASCSGNGLNWVITFRKGISFHNGKPFSARDFVYTVKYIFANETRYSYNVRDIYSIKAVSEDKAAIVLSKPEFNFLANLVFPIIPESGFGESGFNGTGYFKVSEYVKMKKLKLERADGGDKNSVKHIEVQLVPDGETAKFTNANGISDIYLSDELGEDNSDANKGGTKTFDFVSSDFGFILLNNEREVFRDTAVRKAMSLAIDRNEISENILFSKALVTDTPIHSEYYLSDGKESPAADPEKAKQILLDKGYETDVTTGILKKKQEPAGEDEPQELSLKFDILVNNENSFRIQIADSISVALKHIGIEANIKVVDFEEYNKLIDEGEFDAALCLMELGSDIDVSSFAKKDGICRFGNESGSKAINSFILAENNENRKNACLELKKWFKNYVPLISLYYTKNSLHYSDKIKSGIDPTPFNILNNIENWKIDRE